MNDQIGCGLWWKPNKAMTWSIIQVQSMPKMKMSYHDLFDREFSMMKTKQNNDVTKCIGAFNVEKDIKLSWLIGLSVIYDKN